MKTAAATILQPNGEVTDATGRKIIDAFTYKHLTTWVENQFAHTDEVETKLATILDFLSEQDATDVEYWLGRTWWEVLSNAEYAA